jgi:GTP-binding protein
MVARAFPEQSAVTERSVANPATHAATRPGDFPSLLLEATVFTPNRLLYPEAPQIALAGRSNVGKSSLINALAGSRTLAKVSAVPGKTRSINYYRIDGRGAYLVDLPGYGYARCGRAEQNAWAELVHYYLRHTPGLRALALLLDSRRSPQTSDRELLAFADSLALHVLPVLSKADKCGKNELDACKRAWEPFLRQHDLLITSARKKNGITDLWQAALRLLPDIC